MAERPLYTLYKNLKAQNYDVPDDYNKFESALTRDGKGGADNRHAIYENLKAQNFDVPSTYERFYSALFEPRSKTSSRAKGGSVPMSATDRARFSAGAAAISNSAQQTMNNAGRYNRLKQRKQKQQKDFGRVKFGTHQTPFGGDANNVVKDDFAYNPETGKAGAYVTSDNENVYSLTEAEQSQAHDVAYQEAVDTGEIPSVLDVRDQNGNYDLQENIGKNGTYLTEEGAQKQFDKKLEDAYARKKEIEALIAEDNRQHGNPLLYYGASIGAGNGRTAEQSDYRNKLATSLSLVTEQIGALEAVKQYPTSSWGEDALKALDNTAFTSKTWDFGLTDFAIMGQMERIKTKMDNNIPLSGSDKMLLKSKLGADAAAALEDEKMGNIYRWTKIAGQSLPFMADFFLTGGYGGITKGISRGALKFAAKRGMGKVSAAILKNTGIVAGDVIGSYAMAGSEQALKTGADIMQRHLGNLYQDEKGDYKFGTFDENGKLLHEGGESMGTALYKGLTSAMVENYTEKLFGHSYGIKKGAVNFMEKHGMNASAEFFKNIGKSGWYTNSKKWMEKFGINGFAEEVMEEEIGIPLHALLDGEGKVSDLLDTKQQLDIIGGMAISVGSMYAMGAGSRPVKGIYNRAQYYRFRNKVNVADSDAQNLMGDNWADIKDKIDNATNEQMGGVLADILRQRDTMTKEQINAAVNYGVNLMKMRGYNIAKTAEMNAREITNEPTTPEEQHQADIDNAYSEGHDADDADKHDIQIQQEDQMKTLAAALGISEQQLSAMSDEELESLTGKDDKLDQAIYDYQLSSARYQGVVDDAQDKVDLAAHQAEQRVDMYTDQSRGSVRNATIKSSGGLEDYGVYIISGNIAIHDDGSIDVSNSDDMILYYDPTTNSVEHADALMFAELGEELPADDVKAQAVADAKENAIKEVAGIIDGTVEVGSQFNVTDTDGTEHTYEVLADYGDGTAAISIDGNVVENPYQLADLQQMKDLEDQKRLETAKAEREQMEKERAAQQNQETEQTQPSFDFNQILNDNGNVVLADVLGKDGNTKYPNSQLFLIRDSGAKAKVVELKSDGTLVPHAVNKKDVRTATTMTLDEYKQAFAESSMIEDNSGENRGDIEVENQTIDGESAAPTDVVAAPESAETPATEQTPAAPTITLEDGTIVPMLEDGNPDFSKLTAAQTAELYDTQFGEDAESVISSWVSDAKKALDKASNMTVKGKTFVEQKAAKDAKEKAITDAQSAYDSAIAIRDAYNERQLAKVEYTAEGRKALIEKARRKFARLKSAVKDDAEAVSQLYRETIGSLLHRLYDSTGIDVTDTTPLTAEEYVASNLGAHSLNYEGTETSKGVKQETGLSREDFAKTQLLAADGKGTTIDALVHSLWENRPSNLESLDTQDIRNALIGVLNSGFKASEARNFVENIRIAQAENILEEQKRAQENAVYAEQQKAEQEAELKAKSDEKAELQAKSEAKSEEKTHSESFNKIVDLAKKLEEILDNPDNVKEIDDITHEIDELLETLSDEEFKEVSDVLLNIDEDLEYLTADEYERREGVEESKKAKAYNESLQQAIKRIAPYADALKAAVKSGDKKAIAKAQKELADALLASNLGHGYLSGQLEYAKSAKKKDESYSERRALVKPLTDAINAIESALDSAMAEAGLEGVHVDFTEGGHGWIYADKGSAWSSRLKALDNDYRNVSQYETQNPISVLPQVTIDNVEKVAGIIKSRIEEGERYNSDEYNDEDEQTNENINAPEQTKFHDKLKEGSETIEVPEDATEENPLGEQRPEEELPFSARDNGTHQTTSERAADVEKNKVDDMKVVDNIVGEKTRKAFERLAKMMGADIQWQYSDKLGNGWIQETTDADGNVHRTIFITLDSSITEGAQFIFGHEMTHQIKNLNPAAYNELTQLVLDTYGSDAFDKAVDETMKRYSDAGFSGRARDYYAEEVVADAVGEMIRDLNLAHTLAMKMSHPLLAAIQEILQKIKLAFFGTEYSDVTKNIIRSIEQAYVKTANGEVTNSETGEDVSFSLRQKPEPKKKGIGYKVFVLKDGKLYPPMVANPDGAATPVGVWLDADAAPIAGESKTGRPQVKQGGKGTQGGSGKLAYRPGWHLGVVPYAIQFNRKDADGNKTLFPKNFVFAEVEYAADVDYQEEARQEGINHSGKYQHSLAGLKHLPTDGFYMYRTNPNPETDPWVITGAMKVNRILTRAEQAELVKKAGREPQQIQDGDIVTDDVVNSINQEIADAPKFSLKVYHGSGADFTEFDFDHMGEGAGSQAFGWGGYVTSSEEIGKSYAEIGQQSAESRHAYSEDTPIEAAVGSILGQDMYNHQAKTFEQKKAQAIKNAENSIASFSDMLKNSNELDEKGKKFLQKSIEKDKKELEVLRTLTEEQYKEEYIKQGRAKNLYEVDIPEDDGSNYLEWYGDVPSNLDKEKLTELILDKTGAKEKVARFKATPAYLKGLEFDIKKLINEAQTGQRLYVNICSFVSEKDASEILSSLGYTGIKYPAGTIMGGAEEGDTNYVIFKPEDMKITQHTKFSLRLKSAIEETETNPSDAQKESGNYKKGHIKFGGYDYTIENPKGSTRSGKDSDGKEWKVTMHDTYGYIRGKFGKDGDHLDMFINDKADLDNWNGDVFVVDQVNHDGSFDEHKVMYGYDSMDDAKKAYLANYSDGWQGLGNITGASKDEFDKWLDTSNRKLKPFADYAKVKFSQAQSVNNEEPKTFEEFLNHPSLKFSIKNEEQRRAAEDAYEYASKLRPNKYAQYALVDMSNPSNSPEYYEKKVLADRWRRFYNKAVHNELDDVYKDAWGNYKLFDLDRPFADQVNEVKGDVPSEFNAPDVVANKNADNESGVEYHEYKQGGLSSVTYKDRYKAFKQREANREKTAGLRKERKEVEDSYNSKSKERIEYNKQLMKEYMDKHGLSSENDIPYDVWDDLRSKSFEKYQDELDSLFNKYKELDRQINAVAEPRFSLKDEKTLAGVHNITDEKLRKALKLGGFANPSLAVIDTNKSGHDNFGEISFIAPSALLDKRTGKTAGTWITDAYTQRYPSVERQMSEKGSQKFEDWVDSLEYPSAAKAEIKRQTKDVLEDNGVPAWELMYLKEKGIDIKAYDSNVDYRWKEIINKYPTVDEILNSMQNDPELNEDVTSLAKYKIVKPTRDKISLEVRRQIYKETGVKTAPISPKVRKKVNEIFERDYAPTLLDKDGNPKAEDVKKVVEQMVKEHNDTKKYDFYLSKVKASNYVNKNGLYADYIRWQENKLDEFGTNNRIFRGYKKDGSRKYVPETLENVSKAMREEANGQTNGGEYTSFGSFIAKLASRIDSTSEMRANKDKLSSNEDKEEFYDKWSDVYYELAKFLYNDVFYGEQRLHDIVLQADPKKYAKKEYGITLTPTFMKKLDALKNAVQTELKSAYFETKYNRPLRLNEFAAAVVPDNLGEDVRKGIEDAGLPMYEYDPNKEGDRKRAFNEAINSSDNIRFSLKAEKEKIVNDAKANGTYMTAPNGEKTKLNAEQWATVRTTNFKNWFGDWENYPENASKVVDENGEPMVVWHGRSAEFNTFEKKEGVRFIMGLEDKVKAEGFFFSPDKGLAEEFASNSSRHRGGKANVVPCFLNIRRPMDLTGEDYDRIYEDVTGWEYMVGMDTQDNLWGIMDEDGMADKIKEKGYDGAIFVEEVDDSYEPTKISYCALDANQIKSAENNNGYFSAYNNDIRFSLAGERGAAAADKAEERTTRMDFLSVARKMEEEKKDAKTIKIATGWERGADGKWRFEIPDFHFNYEKWKDNNKEILDSMDDKDYRNVMRYEKEFYEDLSPIRKKNFDELRSRTGYKIKQELTLGDVLEGKGADNLFKYYPELRDVKFKFSNLGAATVGRYDNKTKTIEVNDALLYSPRKAERNLQHEVQHVIQHLEGFAKGGNEFQVRGEVKKKFSEVIKQIRQLRAEGKEDEAKAIVEKNRGLYNAYTKNDDYNSYKSLAGEVEARNVQERMNMTSEERRKTLAESTEDVARKDQIFLGVGDVSFSLRDMADGKESGAADMAEDLKSLNTPDEVDDAIKTAIDDMPRGWQMANKKIIHIAQALGENRKSEIAGEEPKFSIRTYHGTGASFDKFDLAHALEGEGSESFGHGVYVTNSSKIGREYAQRAKQRKMADLYKNMRYPDGVKGDIFKRRVFGEMVNDVATGGSVASAKEFAKKRVGADAKDIQRTLENLKDREKGTEYEQNLKDRLAEYKEGLKWIDSLDEDYLTQGNANRYDVDIPDDNGSNYLDWEGTIPDSLDKQKVSDDAYKVVSDNQGFKDFKVTPLNDFIAHTLKTYVDTTDVAASVEKLKSDIKDVIEDDLADDDVLALNEYLKDATTDDVLATIWYNDLVRDIDNAETGEELYRKLSTYVGDNAASEILADNGFVGIKYHAGMIHGGAEEGDYNYVIFNEDNANIVGNTRFSLRYDQFEHDLNQWKKDNNLPKDAKRPTIPQRNAGESAVDFLRRVDEYRKQMALWKTAPTYEQHLLSDDTALGEFNRELQRGSVLKRIAFQDSMLAIRKAQEAIMKEVGVDRLNMAEDAYTAENRSHGKGKNEFEEYNNEFLQPLRKAYHQMKKVLGDSYDNVRVYMMAKHGLERDAQMAFKMSLDADYDDVAQRSAAYKAYKGDMNRIINDSDLEFGRVDFNTWRQRDNALRAKYSPSYMNYRYDKNGIADYSGLSALFDGSDFEEAAYKLVKDIEDKYVNDTHNLWDATNAATKKILRDGYKAGMMSKDTYQYVRDMYSHYIPLRGWDGTTADQVWDYVGGGKGAFNQTLKTAHGRTSIADDPIAYIENMAESGILLNNKNWVKQHLMLLAQNHPTSLLTLSKAWYVKSVDANGNEEWIPATPQITSQMNSNQVKAAIDAFEKKMEQMAQTGDATQKRDGLNIAYPQTHSEEREHDVRVMKDGEEYVIYVNGDPQLAQAMNNTRAHRVREIQSGKLDRAAAWLGRKMAAAYTSLSPLFIPSNYFRDLTMTLASTAIREDAKYNYLLRKNLATSWNLGFMLRDYQNGKLRDKVNNGNATPKEQMFYDFMMNGGETGFVSSLDVEDLKKKFKNDLKDLNRWNANPVKVGHTIMDSIEFLNRAIEDSNRFAVYMTSIQYGRSIDEAVNDAKDVTLNFNRKGTGEYGWQMIRNLYLFINPAVQSLQTLGALAKHHPFKFTAVTASWLASGVLVPIVNAALMSLFGGDDDKDKYWQFSKWDRRNNLIMWVPTTNEFVKIPLAQEFRAFYGVGDMIASKMMGGELAEESWSQYAEDLLGQVVDMLPLDPTGYDGNIAVSLMPNPIRPIFELAFNVDFTGKPLFKETEYNKYDPNFTKAYVGTPDWLVRASRMVNSIGNDYPDVQQNSIDAFGDPRYNLNNPAVVDHVLSSYLGGAYTMGSQVLGLLTKSLNNPKEIKVADIPLFSKFVSNPDDRPVTKKQGDEFWNMKENHDRAANTLSKLKKQAKVDGDYSMLERFYGSDEYKQYKQDDVKVKKYEEDKKKERAEESGEEYRPHKLNADDIYKAHATPKDDFEDLKLKQLYTKLNGFKTSYDLLVDTAPSQSDGYYNTNKAAIDAIDEISIDKQEISELKKGFLDDGKDAYNAEDMKQIRELRKKILAVLDRANKVVVANQKAKTEK